MKATLSVSARVDYYRCVFVYEYMLASRHLMKRTFYHTKNVSERLRRRKSASNIIVLHFRIML